MKQYCQQILIIPASLIRLTNQQLLRRQRRHNCHRRQQAPPLIRCQPHLQRPECQQSRQLILTRFRQRHHPPLRLRRHRRRQSRHRHRHHHQFHQFHRRHQRRQCRPSLPSPKPW